MWIELSNVVKTYGTGAQAEGRTVLNGLNLQAEKGDTLAIMGPSGSGKTTLLNLMGTLDAPDGGEIRVGEQLFSAMDTPAKLAFRSKIAGFVFQFHHLLPQCTLLENVLLPSIPLKTPTAQAIERAQQWMEFLGIWEYRNRFPASLSGGECQRGAVARGLINQPQLLLADEPTGSLDTANAARLIDLLLEVNAQTGITLILATHSASIAGRMSSVYHMDGGRLTKQ